MVELPFSLPDFKQICSSVRMCFGQLSFCVAPCLRTRPPLFLRGQLMPGSGWFLSTRELIQWSWINTSLSPFILLLMCGQHVPINSSEISFCFFILPKPFFPKEPPKAHNTISVPNGMLRTKTHNSKYAGTDSICPSENFFPHLRMPSFTFPEWRKPLSVVCFVNGNGSLKETPLPFVWLHQQANRSSRDLWDGATWTTAEVPTFQQWCIVGLLQHRVFQRHWSLN